MTKEERKTFESALKTCNKCEQLNFALKRCDKDAKNPVYLDSFINGDGFVNCLKPSTCEVE